MSKERFTNVAGACYLSISPYGWHIGKTPWEAMSHASITLNGKQPKIGSKKFLEETEYVSLWYVPYAEDLTQIENFTPQNEQGSTIGVPLFLGLRENLTSHVHETLKGQVEQLNSAEQ